MVVAMSCEIIAIDAEKGTYYKIQSEIDVNKYYIVKFMNGTPVYCYAKILRYNPRKIRIISVNTNVQSYWLRIMDL
jgi:hypothetical protein